MRDLLRLVAFGSALLVAAPARAEPQATPTPLDAFRERVKNTTWRKADSDVTLYFAADHTVVNSYRGEPTFKGTWHVTSLRRLIIDWARNVDSPAKFGPRAMLEIGPDLKTLNPGKNAFYLQE